MTKNGTASIIALAAGIVLCTAARVVGILFFTDMKTGFLFHESEFLYCVIFYVICAASAVLTAAFAPKYPTEGSGLSKNKTLVVGWIMVFMAALAAWDGISNLSSVNYSLLIIIGDFVAAVYIEIVGIVTLVKKKISAGLGFMYSVVGVYFILRAVEILSQRMVIISVQEYLLEVLGVSAGAVCFALFGKIYSDNGEKRSVFFLRFWGSGAAVITVSTFLGAVLAKLFGPDEISKRITADFIEAQRYYQENAMSADGSYMMSFVPYVNAVMGIFAAAAVIMSLSENTSGK
ncbi:MAG: hypothetical protein J1F04_01085 [Oscillospiraceae bacterium]|nr:hypothetical protein [Oscillospiraceae bacterium]